MFILSSALAAPLSFCGQSVPLDTDVIACHDRTVTQLPSLAEFPNLKTLYLSRSGIRDLVPVAACKSLDRLAFSETVITDLSPLEGLPIQVLIAKHTLITDLSALAKLPRLKELHLASSTAKDLQPLRAHPSLEVLNLFGTPVTDPSPLHTAPKLRWVNLDASNTDGAALTALSAAKSGLKGLPRDFPEPYTPIRTSWQTLGGYRLSSQSKPTGTPTEQVVEVLRGSNRLVEVDIAADFGEIQAGLQKLTPVPLGAVWTHAEADAENFATFEKLAPHFRAAGVLVWGLDAGGENFLLTVQTQETEVKVRAAAANGGVKVFVIGE